MKQAVPMPASTDELPHSLFSECGQISTLNYKRKTSGNDPGYFPVIPKYTGAWMLDFLFSSNIFNAQLQKDVKMLNPRPREKYISQRGLWQSSMQHWAITVTISNCIFLSIQTISHCGVSAQKYPPQRQNYFSKARLPPSLLTRKDFHEAHSSQKILHTLIKQFRLWLSSLFDKFFDLLMMSRKTWCVSALPTDLHVKHLETWLHL